MNNADRSLLLGLGIVFWLCFYMLGCFIDRLRARVKKLEDQINGAKKKRLL